MIRLSEKLSLVFLVVAFPMIAEAAPKWVRLSYTGDTAHSMTVSWNGGPADSIVEYGLDTNYGSTATGSSENMGSPLGDVHQATMIGLSADTAYHYRVGGPGDWSQDYTFHTGPDDPCAPFSFGVAADNRQDFDWLPSGCWSQVFGAVVDEGVDFVINSGDLVIDGDDDDQWEDFLAMTDDLTPSFPMMACLGNHDDDSVDGDLASYNQIFAFPRNDVSNTEDYYSFDYGNVHFAVLSTETFKGGEFTFQEQRDWLVQDLSTTDKMWKVVFFHKPIYSNGGHGGNEEGQNPVFIPVFDQYHVDLVLTGHDHMYQKDGPMYADQDVASYDDGTVYMVSGGGGAAMIPPYKHHYLVISVANNVMHVRAQIAETSCLTIGSGGSGIIEEFTMVKTLAVDPCQGTDADGDGYSPPTDCCDDGNEPAPGCSAANAPGMYPGAQDVCEDGIDQNCDGQDDTCPCEDADQDGYPSDACGGDDCDDTERLVNPGALETCGDSVDNDCDGNTDEGDCENCFDEDSDGFFAESVDCPSGTDCDDAQRLVYPGAEETCNQVDDDCDSLTDEDDVCGSGNCVDGDQDGHNAIDVECPAGDDCNDADGSVYPGALEDCNFVDEDCDGLTDEDMGTSTCGIGACTTTVPNCLDGQLTECSPLDRPEDSESSCSDEIDNDCDGYVDAEDSDCGDTSGCGCGPNRTGAKGLLAFLLLIPMGMLYRRRQRPEHDRR